MDLGVGPCEGGDHTYTYFFSYTTYIYTYTGISPNSNLNEANDENPLELVVPQFQSHLHHQ